MSTSWVSLPSWSSGRKKSPPFGKAHLSNKRSRADYLIVGQKSILPKATHHTFSQHPRFWIYRVVELHLLKNLLHFILGPTGREPYVILGAIPFSITSDINDSTFSWSLRDSAFSLIIERAYAFRREPYILLSIEALGIFLKYCSALETPCTFAMRSSWMAASLEVVVNLCGLLFIHSYICKRHNDWMLELKKMTRSSRTVFLILQKTTEYQSAPTEKRANFEGAQMRMRAHLKRKHCSDSVWDNLEEVLEWWVGEAWRV
ncbi:rRNA adenine N-6-methyltransferase [Striga asiatica]|uniref:rRNA adenine N-6-methyltransferase n=1 Tax=Striga asiatica TaxID=4170 RepID=A0A5A7QVL1_STRAF|nr:rRNA adenine N-6-methyltransferase [Striga asiatica]